MSDKQKPDGKLPKGFVPLIRPVERSKDRAPHLDEMDDTDAPVDRDFERLFDRPS